ncbi:MAG: hypothetical protein KDC57_11245 [Saprospiraceae bacterium]|nr:hypothetical protein [Saprospiraceae bacterium]
MRPSIFRFIPGLFLVGLVLFFLPFLLFKLMILLVIGSIGLRMMRWAFWHRMNHYQNRPPARPDTIYALPDEDDEMGAYPWSSYGRYHRYEFPRHAARQSRTNPYRDRDFVSPLTNM